MRRCAHRDCDEYFDETLSVRTVQRYCSDHCRKTEFRKANKVEAEEGGEDVTRDVVRGNELLVEPVSLETALAVASNLYRWAQFWKVRHPDPIFRAGCDANLAEAEPLRASIRRKAERTIAKHRALNG